MRALGLIVLLLFFATESRAELLHLKPRTPSPVSKKEKPQTQASTVQPVPPPDPYAIPIPPSGAYTGAYCPDADSHEVTEKTIYDFEAMAGKKILFVHLFVNWLEDNPMGESEFLRFPAQTCEMIRKRGSIPMITWQANIEAHDPEAGFLLDRIAFGEFDDYLRSWADKIKAHPGPVLLRWGQEMNGNWFSWSGAQNGGDKPLPGSPPGEASGPMRFRRAWIHIHNIFRIQGVTNVRWVWSVYHSNPSRAPWNEIEAYWPGDDRVDWIGISAINWSKANREGWKKWTGFSEMFDACYKRLTSKFPSKPIMLSEWGCANPADLQEGDKAVWIRDAFKLLPKRYPKVKAICWYNDMVEAQLGYFPANFRLDFAPHRKAYAQSMDGSYYLARIPTAIPVLPKKKQK